MLTIQFYCIFTLFLTHFSIVTMSMEKVTSSTLSKAISSNLVSPKWKVVRQLSLDNAYNSCTPKKAPLRAFFKTNSGHLLGANEGNIFIWPKEKLHHSSSPVLNSEILTTLVQRDLDKNKPMWFEQHKDQLLALLKDRDKYSFGIVEKPNPVMDKLNFEYLKESPKTTINSFKNNPWIVKILESTMGPDESITAIDFDSQDKTAAIGTSLGRLILANIHNLVILQNNESKYLTPVKGIKFLENENEIITNDSENNILIWKKENESLDVGIIDAAPKESISPIVEQTKEPILQENKPQNNPQDEFLSLINKEKEIWQKTNPVSILENSIFLNDQVEQVRLAGLGKKKYDILGQSYFFDSINPPLHAKLFQALIFAASQDVSSPLDVERALLEYQKTPGIQSPLLLLAHARLALLLNNNLAKAAMFIKEFIKITDSTGKMWLSSLENDLLMMDIPPSSSNKSIDPPKNLKLNQEWAQIATKLNLTKEQKTPMDSILALSGLEEVKRVALKVYSSTLAAQQLKNTGNETSIFSKSINFAFVGNPGTGKTTVARLFADLLEQSGVRPGKKFIQMTASEAIRKGQKAFAAELESLIGGKKNIAPPPTEFRNGMAVEIQDKKDKLKWYPGRIISTPYSGRAVEVQYSDGTSEEVAPSLIRPVGIEESKLGGILFIDEAYDLDPSVSSEGRAILAEIMSAAEEHRDSLTIILAGYKDEIEQKLFSSNSGMASRFITVPFNDFSQDQLASIWRSMVAQKKWKCSEDVTQVVARRAIRGAGTKGFANARSVRKMFESAASESEKSYTHGQPEILMEHVVGLEPNRQNIPELDLALNQLENLIGLDKAKEAIYEIIKVAQNNYKRELANEPIDHISLNKIFVGNPGTGKTTFASIYGKILHSLRLLSNGEVIYKTASDFVGDVVGESQSKTKAIIEMAKGKVLLIDEAYNLDDNLYGKQVLDTIVEKISGAPGEDICVVLVGYKNQMLKMLRDQNPGLARRFDPVLLEFEDFNDNELLCILSQSCKKNNLTASFDVKRQAVSLLARRRNLPNFGNAGAVHSLVSESVKRISARNATDRVLSIEDVDSLAKGQLAPEIALNDIKGFGQIEKELRNLNSLIALRRQEGRSTSGLLGHYVFQGPPGTGKTTVARTIGKILFSYGILATPNVIETSAQDLIAGYVGHTSKLVEDKLRQAQGGVLFIDEAYYLGQGGFGQEAVAKLLTMLTLPEFMNGKTVVILAGYEEQLHQMLQQNPGLKSRFNKYINFKNLNEDICVNIVKKELSEQLPRGFQLGLDVEQKLKEGFIELMKRPGWANGRDVKEMVQKLLKFRDMRISRDLIPGVETSTIIELEDLEYSILEFLDSRPDHIKVTSQSSDLFKTMEQTNNEPSFTKKTNQLNDSKNEEDNYNCEHNLDPDCQEKIDSISVQKIVDDINQEPDVEKKRAIALKFLGRCDAGYKWKKVSGGWRCEGGGHFVKDSSLIQFMNKYALFSKL